MKKTMFDLFEPLKTKGVRVRLKHPDGANDLIGKLSEVEGDYFSVIGDAKEIFAPYENVASLESLER